MSEYVVPSRQASWISSAYMFSFFLTSEACQDQLPPRIWKCWKKQATKYGPVNRSNNLLSMKKQNTTSCIKQHYSCLRTGVWTNLARINRVLFRENDALAIGVLLRWERQQLQKDQQLVQQNRNQYGKERNQGNCCLAQLHQHLSSTVNVCGGIRYQLSTYFNQTCLVRISTSMPTKGLPCKKRNNRNMASLGKKHGGYSKHCIFSNA